MSRRSRDSFFEVVAPATRAMIERANAPGTHLSNYGRVLNAVLYLTTTWSKVSDRCYVPQIASIAQVKGDADYRESRRELGRLEDDRVVFPGRNRRGQIEWVSIVLPTAVVQPPIVAPVRVVHRASGGDPPRLPGDILPGFRGRSSPHTEKGFRKGSSDVVAAKVRELVQPLGLVDPDGLARATRAYEESPGGSERWVNEVLVAVATGTIRNPRGLFLHGLDRGYHLADAKEPSELDRALAWARTVGWQMPPGAAGEELDERFPRLKSDERPVVVDELTRARNERAA